MQTDVRCEVAGLGKVRLYVSIPLWFVQLSVILTVTNIIMPLIRSAIMV
jgi:hypothetical protein